MRPVVRPGAAVLRRDRTSLQIGVEPGRAVVLADSAGLRELLGRLDGLHTRDTVLKACADRKLAADTLERLVFAGVVVDADLIRCAPAPSELAHLLGHHSGQRANREVRARAAATVGLVAADGDGCELLVIIGELLVGSGVGRLMASDEVAGRVRRRDASAWRHTLPAQNPPPEVAVLVGSPVTGPDTEALVAAGIPHLALSLVDGIAAVGPFVQPGATACVACVDETLARRDPAWPVLVDQLRPANRQPAVSTDVSQPRNRVLEAAVSALAVRELLAHLAGSTVLTLGASLRLDASLVQQVVHRWTLHPACGCSLLA